MVRKLSCYVWPNITGKTTAPLHEDKYFDGAFVRVINCPSKTANSPWGENLNSTVNFDASVINSTFSGSTFQPRAGLTLLCIKI